MVSSISGDELKRVTVLLNDELHKQVKVLSAHSETSMNDILVEALVFYLSSNAKDQEKL